MSSDGGHSQKPLHLSPADIELRHVGSVELSQKNTARAATCTLRNRFMLVDYCATSSVR